MSQSTTFFRLLRADDKAADLGVAVAALQTGDASTDTYTVAPASFESLPGSPLAYWTSERILAMFGRMPRFSESGRHICVTNNVGDDTRYYRASWEVASTEIGRTQRWVPLVKGGKFDPFYSDPHLVVDWDDKSGTYRAFEGTIHRPLKRPASADYFFRPGLTWPRRTNSFGVRVMPSACIFSNKGPALFADSDNKEALLATLAVINSKAFYALLSMYLGGFSIARSFEVGLIQQMPVPELHPESVQMLAACSSKIHDFKRDVDKDDETTHPFTAPALLRLGTQRTLVEVIAAQSAETLARERRIAEIQSEADDRCFALYGFTAEDRALIAHANDQEAGHEYVDDENSNDEHGSAPDDAMQTAHNETTNLVLYAFGCAFGRWDIRIGHDPSLAPKLADPFVPLPVCAPGALVGPDGLPAAPGHIVSEEWLCARPDAITLPPAGSVQRPTIADDEYPIRIAWDGILVDDPEHPADIVEHVREALAVLWPSENGARAEAIEREACEILGVHELRDHFRKPAGFFEDHLKRYSKSRRQAPIYWPLSTASGSYTLWVYYHRLTSDTLYTAVNRYVEPKIAEVWRRLADDERELEGASGREASRLRASVEQGQAFLRELQEFRDELLRVAALPYQPDLNDGVIITAAPLHRLFRLPRWARDTKATWEKLERGDYDWAHLAYTLWPDRVREKCRTDKSLAIAHGLEELYIEPSATAKKARGRKAAAGPEEAELIEVGDEGSDGNRIR